MATIRNVDIFRTREECEKAYDAYAKWNMRDHFEKNDFKTSCLDWEDWFFAEYDPKYYKQSTKEELT